MRKNIWTRGHLLKLLNLQRKINKYTTNNLSLVPLCETSHKGTVHVRKDCGSGLGFAYGEDSCRKN